jgi:putative ABC transport system ATP-binding protein
MAGHAQTNSSISPLRRLLVLLKPEQSDIGVVAIFAIVVGAVNLATPITVEALVNTVAFGNQLQPLVVLGIMLFGFLAFAGVLKALQHYIVEVIQRRIFVRVVADLAHRLPRASGAAFQGVHGPELVNRFFEVATVQKAAALLVLDGIAIVITTLIGMVVLAFYHPYLLGFDIGLVAALLFVIFVLGKGAVRTAIAESHSKYAVASWLEQLAQFPIAFKRQGGLAQAVSEADRLATNYIIARKKHFRVLMRQIQFTLGLQAVAATALLGIGGYLVISTQLTLGQLVAAELIVAVIVSAFAKLGKHMESYYDLLAAVDKLGYLLDLPMERDTGEVLEHREAGASIVIEEVKFDHHHEYPHSQGFSLTVQPGERIAITGPAGSGKSRLLEAIYALRAPISGHIELDEVDLRSIRPSALREQVALVRGIDIIEGTITDNVRMNRTSVSALDVRRSLESLGLWDELMKLPDGLETRLIQGGAPLGSSQLIRLVLARAIAGAPRLLMIDAILDQLSDDLVPRVMEAIVGPEGQRTLLLVTGRIPLHEFCDRRANLGPNDIEPRAAKTPPSAPVISATPYRMGVR